VKALILIHSFWFLLPIMYGIYGLYEQAWGLFFGLLLLFLNILLFAWLGSSQKLFALKTPIVVLKYAIWASLIYFVLNNTTINTDFFVLGLGLFLISLFIFAGYMVFMDRIQKGIKCQRL
jgi:hypothetical protein